MQVILSKFQNLPSIFTSINISLQNQIFKHKNQASNAHKQIYETYTIMIILHAGGCESYLICHSIQDCNNAWKTAANSNANDACQCNTENNKEHIKTEKNYTKPADKIALKELGSSYGETPSNTEKRQEKRHKN